MDDIRDQMDVANEISEAISRPVGIGDDLDEDDLMNELEELEQEELDAKILDTPIVDTPNVPAHEPGIISNVEKKYICMIFIDDCFYIYIYFYRTTQSKDTRRRGTRIRSTPSKHGHVVNIVLYIIIFSILAVV